MNIINKLTLRQLKLNRKRTLVTIIGSIISVAMITAVSTLGISFMDLMQRQEMANNGEWHVVYKAVNKSQIEAIKSDGETKSVVLTRDTGYALLNGSQNKNKPYLFIKEFNQTGFEKFPVELSEGRLPQKPDELVISEAVISNGKVGYKIGDTLTVDIGKRVDAGILSPLDQNNSLIRDKDGVHETLTKESTKTYTIVGIIKRPTWEPTWSPGYTALSYVDETTLGTGESVDAAVILKNVNAQLFDHAKSIANKNSIGKFDFNSSLLRYYGVIKDDAGRNMIYTLSAIIMGIIVIGSVALIYNAFAISVSERSRYLGMLSSVGATKRQKRNSVFFEGFIIGSISIPLGIASGLLGIGITFMCINPVIQGALGVTQNFRLVVLPSTLLLAIAISAATLLISTYIPARRASNISAIDAIRQTSDVRIKGKQVKTSRLTRLIFGIEGDLGLKNLKRNRGRYKATVVSLVISMVLFLVVSYFTSSIKKSVELTQTGINYDIQVTIQDADKAAQEDIIRKITSLDNIKEYAHIDTFDATSWISEKSTPEYLRNKEETPYQDAKYHYLVSVNVLEDEALKAYAQDVGVDFQVLKDTENLSGIVIDTVRYKDTASDKYVENKVINANTGEKLDLTYFSPDLEKEVTSKPIKIAALTAKLPMGVISGRAGASINLVISRDTFDRMMEGNSNVSKYVNTRLFLNTDKALKLQEDIEAIQNNNGEGNIYIFNYYMNREREGQMVLLVSVFFYGFILLITAICIANILNTISTSIALRKREFAMLKSVGMTPKSFNRMINYESIFYGLKALLYGLPLSVVAMYLIHRTLMTEFYFTFEISWVSVGITIASVFAIVGVAMLYSSAKVKKENIIDVLKQEII